MGIYLADTHIHTSYSFDSNMQIKDIIDIQEENNLKFVALTDHVEFSNQPVKEVIDRINRRNSEIDKLQNKTKIKLIKGIEISEPHHFIDECEMLKDKCDLDYIIGSVHHIYGMPLGKMKNNNNAFKLYLKSLLDMVTSADIDTIAHLDYLKYYLSNGDFDEDYIEEILRTIISRNIALEINTSGYRRCREYFPSKSIIETYVKLGGKRITYGSDAHELRQLYDHIEEASLEYEDYKLNQGVYIKRKFRKI